jgi:hypothetical protein
MIAVYLPNEAMVGVQAAVRLQVPRGICAL